MTAWRERLQPASFRGVPFQVEAESGPAGRRTQVHEFVQRDKPFVEDLGRQTRLFKFEAWVSGSDCLDQRDALLAALDKPGAGELVHPWFGKVKATATDNCEYSHDRREGGVVRFQLEFVEGGEKGFPVGTPNTAHRVGQAKVGLIAAASERFSAAMASVNAGRAKVTALQASLAGPYNAAAAHMGEVSRAVGSVSGFVDKLLATPSGFIGLFSSMGSGVSSAADFSRYGASLQRLLGLAGSAKSLSGGYSYGGDSTTATVGRAGQRLTRDALLVQLADEVSAMPALLPPAAPPVVPALEQQVAQPVTRNEVPVADDVLTVRAAIADAFWSAALDSDPEQFVALEEVRKAVHRHLTAVAAAGVRLVEVRPVTTEPALVLAYRRFGDATRAGEIVTRNRLSHPGFVPPVALQVAQE